jgi:hypothetical protein
LTWRPVGVQTFPQLRYRCPQVGVERKQSSQAVLFRSFSYAHAAYLGTAPLTEDDAFRSSPTSIFNSRLGYTFDNGWKVQLDALNLFDTKADSIMYAYGSLIQSDPLYAQCNSKTPPPVAVCQTGVTDFAIHPTEPFAMRLAVTGVF